MPTIDSVPPTIGAPSVSADTSSGDLEVSDTSPTKRGRGRPRKDEFSSPTFQQEEIAAVDIQSHGGREFEDGVWPLTTVQVAREVGCAPQYVGQMRQKRAYQLSVSEGVIAQIEHRERVAVREMAAEVESYLASDDRETAEDRMREHAKSALRDPKHVLTNPRQFKYSVDCFWEGPTWSPLDGKIYNTREEYHRHILEFDAREAESSPPAEQRNNTRNK